jgi:membrane-anchored mycosin MYCP
MVDVVSGADRLQSCPKGIGARGDNGMRGIRLAAVGGCLTLTSFAWLPGAVATTTPRAPSAAPACVPQQPGYPARDLTSEPWTLKVLNFSDVWPLTRGQGITVAVLDSGVDGSHPLLQGRVQSEDVTGTGPDDCVGHGTEAAGIIGAQDLRRTRKIPFYGVAPGAKILSIKMAVGKQNNRAEWAPAAIRKAADMGADVINFSAESSRDNPALRAAVTYAQSKDVVIVAAAGNITDQQQTSHPAYPANYDGVISVGAIKKDGQLAEDFSNVTSPVSVTAPGDQIISTYPEGTYFNDRGTSFATPFVAGTAALVRSYNPRMSYLQVKQAIEDTADGGTIHGTGHGLVNPLRAVTVGVSGANGAAGQGQPQTVSIVRPEPEDRFGRILALSVTGGALVVTAVIVVIGVVIPAGRHRDWSPDHDRRSPIPPSAA